jgi:maltooligosyltrehalose trehalohydrolase
MNSINPLKRTLGPIGTGSDTSAFSVWAPGSKSVSLYFPANGFHLDLTQEEFGYWTTNEWVIKDNELYWLELDGELYPDPVSLSQPEGIHGPSQVIDPISFTWTDKKWRNKPLDEYIIYELHTGTFTSQGTFAGIETKLDYLRDLGITAIEIMPIAQFPGTRNWGYDGVFPFSVQNSYGGPREFQRLVDACHARGIAVVLDVVINHVGPEGNNLQKFGPYFTDKYKTPWGSAINFDDAGCDAVRKYFLENILMWLRDFHVDAIRLDAVHAIRDFGPEHILAELRAYTDMLMSATGRIHYLIAECDLNDIKYIRPLGKSGYGMDAQWIDEFHHSLRVASGQEQSGYYQDFQGVDHLAKSFSSAYVYDGTFSPHRNKTFGTRADGIPGNSFIVFSQNHDQVGNRMLGERTSTLVDFQLLKVMSTAVLVTPYIPLLFMGEEYGETNPFLYFISHTDTELVDAVRSGRKKEFEHFFSGDDFPDPQSEQVFEQSKLSWTQREKFPHKRLFDFYKNLIRLRKETPALASMDRNELTATVVDGKNVISVLRKHAQGDVICFLNFAPQNQKVSLPGNRDWTTLIYSAEVQWGGAANPVPMSRGEIVIEKYSAIVLVAKQM